MECSNVPRMAAQLSISDGKRKRWISRWLHEFWLMIVLSVLGDSLEPQNLTIEFRGRA